MSLEEQRQQKTIGDQIYHVQPIPFGDGRKLLVDLIRLVGTSLIGGASMAAIAHLIKEISDDKIEQFAEAFGKGSWVEKIDSEGSVMLQPLIKQNRPLHFEGKYYEFTQWMAFAIEVNFGPFFAGVKKDLAEAQAAAEAAKAKAEAAKATAPTSISSSAGNGGS